MHRYMKHRYICFIQRNNNPWDCYSPIPTQVPWIWFSDWEILYSQSIIQDQESHHIHTYSPSGPGPSSCFLHKLCHSSVILALTLNIDLRYWQPRASDSYWGPRLALRILRTLFAVLVTVVNITTRLCLTIRWYNTNIYDTSPPRLSFSAGISESNVFTAETSGFRRPPTTSEASPVSDRSILSTGDQNRTAAVSFCLRDNVTSASVSPRPGSGSISQHFTSVTIRQSTNMYYQTKSTKTNEGTQSWETCLYAGLRIVLGIDRPVLLLGNDDGNNCDYGDGGQDAADNDPDSGPAAAPVSATSLHSQLQLCFPLILVDESLKFRYHCHT